MIKETLHDNTAGSAITFTYSKKLIPVDVAIYMFVGFPIIKAMLQVFAPTNSATKYGTGSTFAALAK